MIDGESTMLRSFSFNLLAGQISMMNNWIGYSLRRWLHYQVSVKDCYMGFCVLKMFVYQEDGYVKLSRGWIQMVFNTEGAFCIGG